MGPSRVRHSQSGSAVQLARNTKTKLAADRNRLQPGGAGGGGTDVVERECEEQFLGVVRPARGGLPQVGVVAVGMGDRRTEDRWVGCRAGHAAVADQFDEAAVVEESRESVSSQMDTRAWRSRRRLTRGAMVVSSAYLLAAGSPAREPSGVPGSASAAAGTGWRERISAWVCSCTSQTWNARAADSGAAGRAGHQQARQKEPFQEPTWTDFRRHPATPGDCQAWSVEFGRLQLPGRRIREPRLSPGAANGCPRWPRLAYPFQRSASVAPVVPLL